MTISFDRLAARELEDAGNIASGLNLEGCGEDGHAVANKLWKIAAFLRQRDDERNGNSTS